MKPTQQQPRESLLKLVEYVFQHRDGLIEGVTYQTLAEWIGRMTKNDVGHAHGMGDVLGKMGHLLQGIEGEWGEPIPHIQSLVVQKSGASKGLPDQGIREFWPDYPRMSREEKLNRVRIEHERIMNFGSRWNDVLVQLDLPPITTLEVIDAPARVFGSGGESVQHRAFKEYVSQHPEIVVANNDYEVFVEYALPSGDQIDVVFKSSAVCVAVEVKSFVSDAFPFDYQRGIYQTIKYGALLKAMSMTDSYDIPTTIQSVLVLESTLPHQFRKLAKTLGVIIYENVRDRSIRGVI